MWQLDERARIYAPTDVAPPDGVRGWRILRLQQCRYVDCLIREHWGRLPERYAAAAAVLADARQVLSGEPWPHPDGE